MTNRVGSGLMLAMLLPEKFGVPGLPPLRCFGYPADAALLQLSNDPRPRSGTGPDNRRMNMLEALLNHWYGDANRIDVRDLLQQTLVALNVVMENIDPYRGQPVWSVIRLALQTPVVPALGQRERGHHGAMI